MVVILMMMMDNPGDGWMMLVIDGDDHDDG